MEAISDQCFKICRLQQIGDLNIKYHNSLSIEKGWLQMAVVETDKWLRRYIETKKLVNTKAEIRSQQRKQISDRLTAYFPGATSMEIHHHLLQTGLFMPNVDDDDIVEAFIDKKYWMVIRRELQRLQKDWNGPDIPVFIFPSDIRNRKLLTDFNGLAGLSYHDKVFLFVTAHNEAIELRKLLTHEYNHVCRLYHLDSQEGGLDLLNSLVLEGLAEMAVKERLGNDHLAKWVTLYSKRNAIDHWNQFLKQNQTVKKAEYKHDKLLYGRGFIPDWAGYNAGYYIVSSYLQNSRNTIEQTLQASAEVILSESDFPGS